MHEQVHMLFVAALFALVSAASLAPSFVKPVALLEEAHGCKWHTAWHCMLAT